MYRYSQTLPGGPITLVGIIVFAFLIPGWAATALGFGAANAQLVDWILAHRVIACIPLLLLYGLCGFALLVGAGMTVYVAYVVLVPILRRRRIRLDRLRLPALRQPRRNRLLQWLRRNRLRRPRPAAARRQQGVRLP
jgi:hypothetical protein